MSNPEFEAAYFTPPLLNSKQMSCVAVLQATPNAQTQGIPTLFGKIKSGHMLTLAADGTKCYVAFSPRSVPSGVAPPGGEIREANLTTGTAAGTGTCWPIPDGQERSWFMTGGDESYSGVATMVNYDVLHFKSTATGYLRIYRSSLGPGQDPGTEFKAP